MRRVPKHHDGRMEFRLPQADKLLLQRAATAAGLSLTAFCLRASLAAAQQALAEGPVPPGEGAPAC